MDAVPEVQGVLLLGGKGDAVQLRFWGQSIVIKIGTDTPATVQSALESLVTVIHSLCAFHVSLYVMWFDMAKGSTLE